MTATTTIMTMTVTMTVTMTMTMTIILSIVVAVVLVAGSAQSKNYSPNSVSFGVLMCPGCPRFLGPCW